MFPLLKSLLQCTILGTMAPSEITLEAVPSIGEVSPDDWDACANPGKICNGHGKGTLSGLPGDFHGLSRPAYNPFVSHAFLSAIEKSGSATIRTGWGPRHLVAKIDGRVAGVAPCYLKSHSQGEYVFDRGWADAYERAGGRYYPKLQVSVPFTPATGPRLLVRDGVDHERITEALASGLVALCGVSKASSVHVTFAREAEWKLLGKHGFLQRTDQQFHWHNPGFATFDDFLATLNSRHRKSIKRERRDALAAGVTIHWLTGKDITEDAWDAFFQFYMETGSRKWGRPYLTREFFSLIGETMSQDVLLIMARRATIAGSLARSTSSARTRCSAATGVRSSIIPSCISRSAIIRRSTSPSNTAWGMSRPARRVSTRSRAATCRGPPTPPTSSPIPACAAPSTITSSASAPMSQKPDGSWPSSARSAKAPTRRLDGSLLLVTVARNSREPPP
ncbi:putative N-acyltransferase [Bradyrhizobium sp. LM3.4]